MKTRFLLFGLLSSIFLLGCQRDDICPESADITPFLILRFYDIDDQQLEKAPQNLSIREVGDDTTFVSIRSNSSTITYFRYSQDSIAIPLRTNAGETNLEFILNTAEIPEEGEEPDEEDEENPQNTDILRFSYTVEEEYLNRACGYKANYIGLKVNLDAGEDDSWIQNIQILETNIDDQNNAHVSIFF
ncbi:DUF6452 family protein [Christiangramia portivictoriae]|uniref:DUF6452 family protein n=1 Tax=Christiangramia portivictoriae TaxID=326069 RepID=UPI0004015816|nr:DUF6452 family protein [Christiangramia portivictoriae]